MNLIYRRTRVQRTRLSTLAKGAPYVLASAGTNTVSIKYNQDKDFSQAIVPKCTPVLVAPTSRGVRVIKIPQCYTAQNNANT